MEYAGFLPLASGQGLLSGKPPSSSSPVWVPALERVIHLIPKALSHRYDEHIASFETTYDPLLQFLIKEVFDYENSGNTRTTLYFDRYTDKLVAFCSTKCSSLKIGGDKVLSLCPSIEIAALCVDDKFRYMGVGHAIFSHVLRLVYSVKHLTGVQLVTLFAVPDAVKFYQQLDFRKITKGMKTLSSFAHQNCVPMYLPLDNTGTDGPANLTWLT